MTQEKTETKKEDVVQATGRRKQAIARVRLVPNGKGGIFINGKGLSSYFSTIEHQTQVRRPLIVAEALENFDVKARVNGGGLSGQAGAVSLGIARALLEVNPQLRSVLRKEDLLTRDPRAKERKKYGRKGARRRFQWTKR